MNLRQQIITDNIKWNRHWMDGNALKWYGKPYDDLTSDEQEFIDEIHKQDNE